MDEIVGKAFEAIGGLGFVIGELHKRGDLTDYGLDRCRGQLNDIRVALSERLATELISRETDRDQFDAQTLDS